MRSQDSAQERERGGFLAALRERTRALHGEAEKSGVIGEILQSRASTYDYAVFLRNLLPAYVEMERGLEQHRQETGFLELARPEIYRAHAIEADLQSLEGRGWHESLPLLDAAKRYAARAGAAAEGDGSLLVAHVYARYLGDMSGGRIISRLLSAKQALPAAALSFYDYPRIDDLANFKMKYRDAIERAAGTFPEIEPIMDEAVKVFRLNIEVSLAVQASSATP